MGTPHTVPPPDPHEEPGGAGSPQPADHDDTKQRGGADSPQPAGLAVPAKPGVCVPRILFRDEAFVAVHKPSGLMVHREFRGQREDALLQWLRDHVGQHVFPVHRIDRSSSGIVLFGLSSEAARAGCKQFQQHDVRKTYLAVVRGYADESGRVDTPMRDRDGGPKREALTEYQRLATVELPHAVGPYATSRYSLVRAHPKTGRWHQIRRHFNYISHPIVGDTTHGDDEHNIFYRDHFGLNRLLLSAVSLHCRHPLTNAEIHIRTTLDDDLVTLFHKFGWPTDIDTLVGGPPGEAVSADLP